MATAIPDLWADDIKVNVATPLMILRTQEGLLAQKTKGILRGQVATTTTDKWIQHQLDLIAPALQNYRITLLRASHHKDAVYPVYVETFRVSPERDIAGPVAAFAGTASAIQTAMNMKLPEGEPAHSEDEFIQLVRKALQSGDARAVIESLIARSNEIHSGEASAESASP